MESSRSADQTCSYPATDVRLLAPRLKLTLPRLLATPAFLVGRRHLAHDPPLPLHSTHPLPRHPRRRIRVTFVMGANPSLLPS